MRRATFLILAGALLAPSTIEAQVARDRAERVVDAAQLMGDVADVRRLERLVAELDQARTSGNKAQEQNVQGRIALALRQEAAEGRRDARQDARETAASRREIRRDRAASAGIAARADDRRDLRDDRRDVAASRQRAQRQQQIMVELRQIQPQVAGGNAEAVARQRTLLDEFLSVSRADAKANGRELGEDRRETREDIRRP